MTEYAVFATLPKGDVFFYVNAGSLIEAYDIAKGILGEGALDIEVTPLPPVARVH